MSNVRESLRVKLVETYTQVPKGSRKSRREPLTAPLWVSRKYDDRLRQGFRMLAESYDERS